MAAAPAIALEVGAPTTESGEAETRDAPREDPFGLDPGLRRRVLPAARFLHDRYWRIEMTGIRHVPTSGPALLVANHSGAIPFDGAMIVTSVELRCQRRLRFLYDRFVENLAPGATFYDKMGGYDGSGRGRRRRGSGARSRRWWCGSSAGVGRCSSDDGRGGRRRGDLPPHRWRRVSRLRRRAARLEPAGRRLPRGDGVLAVCVRLARRAVLRARQPLCGADGGRVDRSGRRRGGGAAISASAAPARQASPSGHTCRRRGAAMAAPPPRRCVATPPPGPPLRGRLGFLGGRGCDHVEGGEAGEAEGGERVEPGEEALGALAA